MRFSSLSFLVLTALGSALLPAGLAAETEAEKELAALRAENAALRATLATRDDTIRELETRTAALQTDIAAVQQTVALASSDGFGGQGGIAPTSALDWASAMKVATAARYLVKGSSLLTVMPTGSMKPVFDERAILLTEAASYDDLKIGDIVTYKHPRYGMPVVHRILEKRGDKFWAKGDNNGRMDEVYITRKNYQGRVFGIIYAREPSAQAQRFSPTLARR
ncbi:MAG TPA: signal peptidase I [Opitutaceae bacterium]|nr:signal peptidase I [Opitutaceae bacterium]